MGDTIRSFRDLRVWQAAQHLCVDIYKATSNFPTNEQFGLTSQVRRAAVSIPSNIAEGFGRRGAKEKSQFYHHSLGSLFEIDTQLELASRLGFVQQESYDSLRVQIEHCKAMLIKLVKVNKEFSVNR